MSNILVHFSLFRWLESWLSGSSQIYSRRSNLLQPLRGPPVKCWTCSDCAETCSLPVHTEIGQTCRLEQARPPWRGPWASSRGPCLASTASWRGPRIREVLQGFEELTLCLLLRRLSPASSSVASKDPSLQDIYCSHSQRMVSMTVIFMSVLDKESYSKVLANKCLRLRTSASEYSRRQTLDLRVSMKFSSEKKLRNFRKLCNVSVQNKCSRCPTGPIFRGKW